MSFAFLRRDADTAARVREILGLPGDAWSEVSVEFSLDSAATATVTMILTREQLSALALLCASFGES